MVWEIICSVDSVIVAPDKKRHSKVPVKQKTDTYEQKKNMRGLMKEVSG